LERIVEERTAALRAAHEETLDALVFALDSREHATAGHSRRVAIYCLYLAIEVGLAEDRLEDLHSGALLHDIGKIGVPDAILLKQGPLDADERKTIAQHVLLGGRLLERIGYLRKALLIPRYHHERFDGTGYCERLAGEAIPIEARIFALVDVYDALGSERSYKPSMSHAEASEMIRDESGNHFDPVLAARFLATHEHVWETLAGVSQTTTSYAQALAACRRIRKSDPACC
jgi:HD-GYP domain-containing protein (c-di-GMP phosphodiesterase class II)